MSTGKKRALVYLVMILSLLISIKLFKEIIKLKSANKRLIEAEEELLWIKQEQTELKKKLVIVEDRAWWETRVRNVLNMAKLGEIVVVVPEEIKRVKEEPSLVKAMGGENLSNPQKWWRALVD